MGAEASSVVSHLRRLKLPVSQRDNPPPRTWWLDPAEEHLPGGLWLRSPYLDESDLPQLKAVTAALQEEGAKVNRQCSFIVHVNSEGLSTPTIRNLLARYCRFESYIDQMMPASRRTRCPRAKDMNHPSVDPLLRVSSDKEFLKGLSTLAGHKLDLSLLEDDEIVFRHHSGTLNFRKMVFWIRFCWAFIHASNTNQERVEPLPFHRLGGDGPRTLTRTRNILQALRAANAFDQDSALSREQISLAVGLTARCIPSYISRLRRLGFNIKNRRATEDTPTGYFFASTDGLEVRLQYLNRHLRGLPQLDNASTGWDSLFPSEVRSFYRERIVELS